MKPETDKKPRGRRPKKVVVKDTESYDLTQYLRTDPIKINGHDYLIDDQQLIFEANATNVIVGRIVDGQYEWFGAQFGACVEDMLQ